MSQQPTDRGSYLGTLIAGTVLALATLAAYLYAAAHQLDFAPILSLMGTVIVGLLVAPSLDKIKSATQRVEQQTNGALDARLEAKLSQHRSAIVGEFQQLLQTRDQAKVAAAMTTQAQTSWLSPAPSYDDPTG